MGRLRLVLRGDGVDLSSPGLFDDPHLLPGERDHDWFLTAAQRGNAVTRIRPWTNGNLVRPRVHGSSYFAALLEVLADAGAGDVIHVVDWRGDPDERLAADGPTVAEALRAAARRGAGVRGLTWRSHLDRLQFPGEANRNLAREVNAGGGEVLLDQRVRPFGSHHQKFVVVRHPSHRQDDVAFVGGIDLAHTRRDDATHRGDPQAVRLSPEYGDTPPWHDVQLELRGPAVRDVDDVFRERWLDGAALSRLPWHAVPDILRRLDREADRLPQPLDPPPEAGSCSVQLLRTYPNRWPGYPFAPDGERSVARGYVKALRRARRLVYVEDQFFWSHAVAQAFATALRRSPDLHLVLVLPRFPDDDGIVARLAGRLGRSAALETVREAGGDRVHVLDVENREGAPVYVHAKVCIVDDVWAAVGSANVNRRSWTHDSELTVAVVDEERDPREPRDPGGLGDGARRFARELRLDLWREHLDRDDVGGLVDPDEAVRTLVGSAETLEAWYAGGRRGPRPPGRLRTHHEQPMSGALRMVATPLYRVLADPDGRPARMRVHHSY